MIVVLGLYRGGSSAVAGVLHQLGVCMGHALKVVPEAESHRYVTYEDWAIRKTCLRCMSEPQLEPRRGFDGRVALLRDYAERRRADELPRRRPSLNTVIVPRQRCTCDPIGVKFPMLCAMGPEILDAWGPGVRFVSVHRDSDTVIESVKRWYPQHAASLTQTLIDERDRFLSDRDHVAVDYDELLGDPVEQVLRLVKLLDLRTVDGRHVRRAIAFVRRPGVAA